MTEKIRTAGKDTGGGGGAQKKRSGPDSDTDVGNVLRSAYQQTVSEGVPDELMDLLNRLD